MNSCEALRAVYFDFYCMNAHVVSHTGTLSGDFWQREINVVSHTTRQKTPNKPPVDRYVVSHTKSVDRYVVSHTKAYVVSHTIAFFKLLILKGFPVDFLSVTRARVFNAFKA